MPSLTVATYNIRHATLDEEPDTWEQRRPGVLARVRAADPDVLGLQESTGEQHEDVATALPAYEWTGVADEPGSGEHNPVGYRPPWTLVDAETRWLSESGDPGSVGWDAAHARVVTVAHLRNTSTGNDLTVCNTHLDHVGSRARSESVQLVREYLSDRVPDHPVVVLGDFNAGPGGEAYDRLRDGASPPHLADARCVADDVAGPATTLSDFEALRPDRRVDHVFVAGDLNVLAYAVDATTVDGRFPSDHLPVVVDLSL